MFRPPCTYTHLVCARIGTIINERKKEHCFCFSFFSQFHEFSYRYIRHTKTFNAYRTRRKRKKNKKKNRDGIKVKPLNLLYRETFPLYSLNRSIKNLSKLERPISRCSSRFVSFRFDSSPLVINGWFRTNRWTQVRIFPVVASFSL